MQYRRLPMAPPHSGGTWIPAFAGMTGRQGLVVASQAAGHSAILGGEAVAKELQFDRT